MAVEPIESTSFISTSTENTVAIKYDSEFVDNLSNLSQAKHGFDVIVVDASESGFLFNAEVFVEAARLSSKVLNVQGCIVFVKQDKVVALIRESFIGLLSFHVFETFGELHDYSPSLARHVKTLLGCEQELSEESSDLSEQVLMAVVPVLTTFGIKLKAGMESNRRRNAVLAAIDNYSPLSSIVQRIVNMNVMSVDELMGELKALEELRAIYPVFAKVPFLVHCFKSRIAFKLKDYLLASRLISQDQLQDLSLEIQNASGPNKLSLGALCVSKGYISTRQLEIALQDQAFYGQSAEKDKLGFVANASSDESLVKSLVGHLGTTDPSGLLQSLVTNRESGVLSVEHHGAQFRAVFDQGKLTHAKLGKLLGPKAVVQFVSTWKEGIFVFIQRQAPDDLVADQCKVERALEKLLLDGALASDNIATLFQKLPFGERTLLERKPDQEERFDSGDLVNESGAKLTKENDTDVMRRLWKALDGLVPVIKTFGAIEEYTSSECCLALERLMLNGLVQGPTMNVHQNLEQFQRIVTDVAMRLPAERNVALLRLSLQATQGYSPRARIFNISKAAEIGVDIAAAKSAGVSLSMVLNDLENWQVKYIEYLSQEIDRDSLREIVYKVHQ